MRTKKALKKLNLLVECWMICDDEKLNNKEKIEKIKEIKDIKQQLKKIKKRE